MIEPITFSTEFFNISEAKYTEDEKNHKNAGYAGGTGEDEERLIYTVFEDDRVPAGFDRREIWLDCGNIDNIDDLIYEANYKLKDHKRVENLTGSAINAGLFKYLKNWDIGNVVTLRSKKLRVSQIKAITEIDESYEAKKISIKPTFGQRKKNILDKIKKMEVVK